ncbi:unnamed protein product [Anisakis simplex]|uniref:Protein aurora borealis n=1 Tax=Anisakis simplex TaxID=6269 RepID=A0A0M3JZ25_ANISI|nr:unnamed protein product [Anisakis simplex]
MSRLSKCPSAALLDASEGVLEDRPFEANATIKSRARSPYSGQSSSPFSSNISETELDASSLSPHSSCSSLNQLNTSTSNSQSKLLTTHPSSSVQQQQQSPLSLSNHPRPNSSDNINSSSTDSLIKMRVNHNAKKGDSSDDEADNDNEDTVEDDSNSSSNDVLNSRHFLQSFFGNNNSSINERLRNGNEGVLWRHHIEHTLPISHELLGRKFSLNSAIPNSQCYSPSTQQIVRNNITYSPSPSPTPSPTRRIMRSLSPIAVRQITKRRYTNTTAGGVDSDGESSTSGINGSAPKRACISSQQWSNGGSSSPLANERLSYLSALPSPDASLLSSSTSFPTADSRMNGIVSMAQTSFSAPQPPYRSIVDSNAQRLTPLVSPMDSDESISNVGDEEITSQSHSPPTPKQTVNKGCDDSFTYECVSNKNDETLSSSSSSASVNNNIRESESL